MLPPRPVKRITLGEQVEHHLPDAAFVGDDVADPVVDADLDADLRCSRRWR